MIWETAKALVEIKKMYLKYLCIKYNVQGTCQLIILYCFFSILKEWIGQANHGGQQILIYYGSQYVTRLTML